MQRFYKTVLMLSAATLLAAGCGFKMRGADLGLPFQRIVLQGDHQITEELRESLLRQPSIQIKQKPIDAQVVLIVMGQRVDREVTAFNAAGRPREIQIRLRVTYRVTDGMAVELFPSQEIAQTQDLTVNEAEILSSSLAENVEIAAMQADIARQILRRLRAVKLPQ